MKELKIDQKLKSLFKPLPRKELEELREKLLTKYDGTPLYIWKGEIIVDGHNRYPILKENNIDFATTNVEDFLGQDCTKADVMQWMISHQQARRNLELGELIYANSMVAEEIALENKKKMLEGYSKERREEKASSVQVDGGFSKKKSHTSPTHTREQVAKMSGVGVGTVARYDAVMKSDDEALKRKVQTGEVKIGTAYREVKKKESKRSNSADSSYKDVANNYAGTQSSGHFGEYYETAKTTDKTFTEEDVVNAYKDTKTEKNALDMLNISDEFNIFREDVAERLNTYKNRLFAIYHIQDKISEIEREYAIEILNSLITSINEIINTIKGE